MPHSDDNAWIYNFLGHSRKTRQRVSDVSCLLLFNARPTPTGSGKASRDVICSHFYLSPFALQPCCLPISCCGPASWPICNHIKWALFCIPTFLNSINLISCKRSKEYILYDYIYIKNKSRQNAYFRNLHLIEIRIMVPLEGRAGGPWTET